MTEIIYNPLEKQNNNTPTFSNLLLEHTNKLPVRFTVPTTMLNSELDFASDTIDIVIDSVSRYPQYDSARLSTIHLEGVVNTNKGGTIYLKPFLHTIAEKYLVFPEGSALGAEGVEYSAEDYTITIDNSIQNLADVRIGVVWVQNLGQFDEIPY